MSGHKLLQIIRPQNWRYGLNKRFNKYKDILIAISIVFCIMKEV